jgi:hypothetical protein
VIDEEAPPEGDAAEPAFVLHRGVAYVRGWAYAEDAVARLRAELAGCGLAGRVAGVHAEVTVAGVGVVDLGRVTPATAEMLAALLAIAQQATNTPQPTASTPDAGGRQRAA